MTPAYTSEVLAPGTALEELDHLALPPDVHVVDSAEDAQRVAQHLLTNHRHCVLAVDTEVGLWPRLAWAEPVLEAVYATGQTALLEALHGILCPTCLKSSFEDLLLRAHQPGGLVFPGHFA